MKPDCRAPACLALLVVLLLAGCAAPTPDSTPAPIATEACDPALAAAAAATAPPNATAPAGEPTFTPAWQPPPRSAYAANPPPTPQPGTVSLTDITFADSLHAWALVTVQADEPPDGWALVLRTQDGGLTWEALPSPEAITYFSFPSQSVPTIVDICFADRQHGMLAGTRLFVTADGGQSWTDLGPYHWSSEPPPVQLDGGQFSLRLTQCQTEPMGWLNRCQYTLWQANRQRLPVTFEGQGADLVAASSRTAWIIYSDRAQGGEPLAGHLLSTGDGGRTWTRLPDLPRSRFTNTPLQARFGFFDPVDEQTIWLATDSSQAGIAAEAAKAIYVSTDGGRTWDLRAQVGQAGGDRVGVIGQQGSISDFEAVTTERAFMALYGGTVLGTFDGGRTWRAVIPLEEANPHRGEIGPLRFLDAQHGWVLTRHAFYHTVDGGVTWQAGSMPGLRPGPEPRVPIPTLDPYPVPASTAELGAYPPPVTP